MRCVFELPEDHLFDGIPMEARSTQRSPKKQTTFEFKSDPSDIRLKNFLQTPIDSRGNTAFKKLESSIVVTPSKKKRSGSNINNMNNKDWDIRFHRLAKFSNQIHYGNLIVPVEPHLMNCQPNRPIDPYGRTSVEELANLRTKPQKRSFEIRKVIPPKRFVSVSCIPRSPIRKKYY